MPYGLIYRVPSGQVLMEVFQTKEEALEERMFSRFIKSSAVSKLEGESEPNYVVAVVRSRISIFDEPPPTVVLIGYKDFAEAYDSKVLKERRVGMWKQVFSKQCQSVYLLRKLEDGTFASGGG